MKVLQFQGRYRRGRSLCLSASGRQVWRNWCGGALGS
jgi:hypothetical protein